MDARVKTGISMILAGLVGIGVGYRLMPKKIEIKTEIVTKVVEKKHTDRDIKTTTTRTVDEKGRPVETVVTVDKSKDDSTSKTDSDSKTTTKVTNRGPEWAIGGGALWNLGDRNRIWYGTVEKRLFGEVWVGVMGTSAKQAGVGITIRF